MILEPNKDRDPWEINLLVLRLSRSLQERW
jgi:hypothetical protein